MKCKHCGSDKCKVGEWNGKPKQIKPRKEEKKTQHQICTEIVQPLGETQGDEHANGVMEMNGVCNGRSGRLHYGPEESAQVRNWQSLLQGGDESAADLREEAHAADELAAKLKSAGKASEANEVGKLAVSLKDAAKLLLTSRPLVRSCGPLAAGLEQPLRELAPGLPRRVHARVSC